MQHLAEQTGDFAPLRQRHLNCSEPRVGAASAAAQPVSNDIAAILRRMQPRWQRYPGGLLTDQRAHGPGNRAEVADHPLQFALAEANPLRLVRDERADRRRPAHPTLDVQATGQHSRVEVPRQRRPRVDEQLHTFGY